MTVLTIILIAMLDLIPSGQAWLQPLQQRDSALVADQFEYGFELKSLEDGTALGLQDFGTISSDTLALVRSWKLDTLRNKKGLVDLRGSVRLALFEEGHYELPDIAVLRRLSDGQEDTLLFDAQSIDVYSMPVDTATFVINDIKAQIQYPVTFQEVLPWGLGGLLLAALVVLAVYLIKKAKAKREGEQGSECESPYIVALRSLDKLRGNKLWVAEKQKIYYSGITDALKIYIGKRFDVDAPEMTTAEVFSALKASKEITPDLFQEAKELFELADFVKFAKHIASDEENSNALPTAIRFVMNTYQTELEEEPGEK